MLSFPLVLQDQNTDVRLAHPAIIWWSWANTNEDESYNTKGGREKIEKEHVSLMVMLAISDGTLVLKCLTSVYTLFEINEGVHV